MRGLYIHIPFCRHICHYCDFPKRIAKDQASIDAYLDALLIDWQSYKQHASSIKTVYFGGGTPSLLSINQLEKLFTVLQDVNASEITFEVNPEDVTDALVKVLVKNGINRVSMGVQTFNEDHLKKLNRYHTNDHVYKAIEMFRNAELFNISIDLIFAIPGETVLDVKQNIQTFLDLKLPHLSYYSLILEERTVFHHELMHNRLKLVSEEIEGAMFECIIASLENTGYHHYEISNYALPGYESRHNQVYWKNLEYIAIGAGASGYLDGIRYQNNPIISSYMTFPRQSFDIINEQEQMKEFMMLGLRMLEGVSVSDFYNRYQKNVFDVFPEINDFIDKSMLKHENDRIFLTKKSLFVGNHVFSAFV